MKRLVFKSTLLSALCLAFVAAGAVPAQEKKEMTVEWIYSKEAGKVTAVPAYHWLRDGTAIIYDSRQPEQERTFERLNAQTGKREPILDMRRALANLQPHLGKEEMPTVLPWPTAIDTSGRYAVYEFNNDIYLLNLTSAQFQRVTKTEGVEEKAVSLSPDGEAIGFVRNNDLYVYDIKGNQERRLTM
ncbi:MAG TPA: DPP IV N-terminal domain-containing protein, partial [Pyrinomonadaceae bacterium]